MPDSFTSTFYSHITVTIQPLRRRYRTQRLQAYVEPSCEVKRGPVSSKILQKKVQTRLLKASSLKFSRRVTAWRRPLTLSHLAVDDKRFHMPTTTLSAAPAPGAAFLHTRLGSGIVLRLARTVEDVHGSAVLNPNRPRGISVADRDSAKTKVKGADLHVAPRG